MQALQFPLGVRLQLPRFPSSKAMISVIWSMTISPIRIISAPNARVPELNYKLSIDAGEPGPLRLQRTQSRIISLKRSRRFGSVSEERLRTA